MTGSSAAGSSVTGLPRVLASRAHSSVCRRSSSAARRIIAGTGESESKPATTAASRSNRSAASCSTRARKAQASAAARRAGVTSP